MRWPEIRELVVSARVPTRSSASRTGALTTPTGPRWKHFLGRCGLGPKWSESPVLASESTTGRVTEGFIRPCTPSDVAGVLGAIPSEFLIDLTGVYLLGGTTRQRGLTGKVTYGMYGRNRIYRFAIPKSY